MDLYSIPNEIFTLYIRIKRVWLFLMMLLLLLLLRMMMMNWTNQIPTPRDDCIVSLVQTGDRSQIQSFLHDPSCQCFYVDECSTTMYNTFVLSLFTV